jgi:hypothetical protein
VYNAGMHLQKRTRRGNVNEWSAEDLWNAYIQLTEAEAAYPHTQERPWTAADLASEEGESAGAHTGMLPGIRAAEGIRRDVQSGRAWG